MAFIPRPEEENKQDPNQQGRILSQPTETGGGVSSAGGTPGPQAGASGVKNGPAGAYSNLRQYLDSNSAGAQDAANRVIGDTQSKVDTADKLIGDAVREHDTVDTYDPNSSAVLGQARNAVTDASTAVGRLSDGSALADASRSGGMRGENAGKNRFNQLLLGGYLHPIAGPNALPTLAAKVPAPAPAPAASPKDPGPPPMGPQPDTSGSILGDARSAPSSIHGNVFSSMFNNYGPQMESDGTYYNRKSMGGDPALGDWLRNPTTSPYAHPNINPLTPNPYQEYFEDNTPTPEAEAAADARRIATAISNHPGPDKSIGTNMWTRQKVYSPPNFKRGK